MRCQRLKIEGGCCSPVACKGFGYCRERNFNHNGDPVYTPEAQAAWRYMDWQEGDGPKPPKPNQQEC